MSAAAPETTTVVERIEINAAPDRVFDALVEPEQLRHWWGSADTYTTEWQIDLRVGGEYLCTATAGAHEMTVHGRFLEIDRPRRLVYTWNASWDPTGETTVQFDLIPHGNATVVQVTHSGFVARADRGGYADGWKHLIARLDPWLNR